MASEFWVDLAASHSAGLEKHGFDEVKRVQALRYFTWRWTRERILRTNEARHLLRQVSPLTTLRAMLTPVDTSDRAWFPTDWHRRERWAFAVASRLIWEIARRGGSQVVIALPEPLLGDPFPVRWRGRLISQDLANTALEVASIESALDGGQPQRILEVGAGYGRTAYGLLSRFPSATYTIVDIPPALDISRWYLTTLFPDRDLRFIDARSAEPDGLFDLALTISSLAEMPLEVAARYIELFAILAAPKATVYIKQWADWRNPADGNDYRFDDSTPAVGSRLFRRKAQIQITFIEAAWRMPA